MNFIMLSAEAGVSLPLRIIGLVESPKSECDALFTTYHAKRYSRTAIDRQKIRCWITPGYRDASRCTLDKVK